MVKGVEIDEEATKAEWSSSIGRLMMAFGEIEAVTQLFLYKFPRDAIFETTARLNFGVRTRLVADVVENHPDIETKSKTEFVGLLKEARRLSDTRNIIAHSPLMMRYYEHPIEGWQHYEIVLGNVRNREEPITKDALKDIVEEVETLARSLWDSFAKIGEQAGVK